MYVCISIYLSISPSLSLYIYIVTYVVINNYTQIFMFIYVNTSIFWPNQMKFVFSLQKCSHK